MHKSIRIVTCAGNLYKWILRPWYVLLFLFPMEAYSQITATEFKKMSPVVKQKSRGFSSGSKTIFFVSGKDRDSLLFLLQGKKDIEIVYEYSPTNLFAIKASWKDILSILNNEHASFVDMQRKPKEELALSNLDISANKVNLVHNQFPFFNGQGTTVSIKENHPDSSDIDFRGRYLSTTLSSSVFSTHASDMATIIAGGGNTYYEGKGVAWGATISSSGFDILLPEADAAYGQYGISVQNHSYGTGIENYYGSDAAAYDASVITRPDLLHVFSAGNSGMETDTIGTYSGVTGYANITGSFKMAKNIITVGHVDSIYNVLPPSSKGPAYDGRVKPELVAFAEDGSSGSAAIVSGLSLVLQQAYKDSNGKLPTSALIKSILLNSADDVDTKGIDYTSGYGNVNAYKAVQTLVRNRYFTGSVSSGQTVHHNLSVPAGLKQLKATLTWTDPPASPGASKALVNDLDLTLSLPALNQSWLPWVLNSTADIDSLKKMPVRKRDSLNNTEQITIDNPLPGDYELNVYGFDIISSPQSYYISYQFDSVDKFQWYYPSANDNIFGNRLNTLRWDCSYPDSTGRLDYSIDDGNTWQTINNEVLLSKGYYKWSPPDSFTTALLRMRVATSDFLSDTFTISDRFDVHVGFNCTDSFLLFWPDIPGVSKYRILKLGEKYMAPLTDVTDTFWVAGKQANPVLYYAVTPLVNNKEGVRSYGFNYTTQGTGCYIQSFLAQLSGTNGVLYLQLGSVYHIRSLTWQKLLLNEYINLQTIQLPEVDSYDYTDATLTKGVNTYRVKLELTSGQVIYSDPASLYYFGRDIYIVYPNPVAQNQPLTVLSNDPDITILEVFNSYGAKVMVKQLDSQVNTFPVARLGKGIYFMQIVKDGRRQQLFKVFIY